MSDIRKHGRYFVQTFALLTSKTLSEPVGNGMFKVSLRLYYNGKASPFYIAFRFADSKGATSDIAMSGGYISKFTPVYVQGEFEGPGHFVAYVLGESVAEMGFAGYIRSVHGF